MYDSNTVGDVAITAAELIPVTESAERARAVLPADSMGVLVQPPHDVPVAVCDFDALSTLPDGALLADHAWQPILTVPADLPLDLAFQTLMENPEVTWLVTDEPSGGTPRLLARVELVPPSLEVGNVPSSERSSLPGDPISRPGNLRYRCPLHPADGLLAAHEVVEWTWDMRAVCPHDQQQMVPILPHVGAA